MQWLEKTTTTTTDTVREERVLQASLPSVWGSQGRLLDRRWSDKLHRYPRKSFGA